MNYLITDFCRDDQPVINNLRAMGYFVYALRDGEGIHYTVEPKVFVNNIGFVVTDKPIEFHEEGSRQYITDIELTELGTEDIGIKSVIERAREMKVFNVVLVTTRNSYKIDEDFLKDLEEAVLYASHNLALRHNCTIITPLERTECLPDRAVRLHLLTESEDITIDNMGKHLKGISAYLLKKWPDKYNKYKRGTRLFYIMEGSTWK